MTRTPVAFSLLMTVLLVVSPRAASAETPPVPEILATIAMYEDTRVPDVRQVAAYLKADFPPEVRARAARALARLQDSTGVEALVDRLRHDESVDVRREAAFALGQIGHAAGFEGLARAASEDLDLEVRALSLEAIGKVGGSRAAAAAMRALTWREPLLRREAAVALWRAGDSLSARPTVEALADEDDGVRWRLVWALEKMPAPRLVVPALVPLARDSSALVRSYVARTLGRQGDRRGTGALIDLLDDPDLRVRVNAARALAQLADSAAVPQLLAALGDSHPYVREVALGALSNIGDRAVQPAVLELRADPVAQVRAATAAALVSLSDSTEVVALLTPLLRDPSEYVRALTAQAMGGVRVPKAAEHLRKLLASSRAGGRERAAAASALGQLRDRKAIGDLRKALGGKEPAVVASAAAALAEIDARDQATASALVRAVRENASPNEPDIAVAGLEALTKLESRTAEPLAVELLISEQPQVREAARAYLAKVFGEDRVAQELARLTLPGWEPAPVARYRDLIPAERRAVVTTSQGVIEIELFAEESPLTVTNFLKLARKGYFDGLALHRVVPNFVVQDGDPTGTGWGGPGYAIRCEYNRHRYDAGMVGMALAGKDTGGSQYFITHSPQLHLDGRYTIFGRVVRGLDLVSQLTVGDRVLSIEVR